MKKLKEWFPANRVFALIGLIGSIATALATFQTSLVPGSPAEEAISKAIVLLGCLGTALGIIWKFMDGSQKIDQQAHDATVEPTGSVTNTTVVPPGTGSSPITPAMQR